MLPPLCSVVPQGGNIQTSPLHSAQAESIQQTLHLGFNIFPNNPEGILDITFEIFGFVHSQSSVYVLGGSCFFFSTSAGRRISFRIIVSDSNSTLPAPCSAALDAARSG